MRGLCLIDVFAVLAALPADAPFGQDTLNQALAGDAQAQRALFDALLPHVQKRVNAVLMRRAAASGRRPTRQAVLDLTQDVFVALFEHDGKALRRWDPALGASLPTWVGRIAEKKVISTLRIVKRNPWTETPSEDAALMRAAGGQASHHDAVASRDELARVLDILRAELSPQAYALFVELYVQQREVGEVAAAHEMTSNAVYIWRTRLKKAAKNALLSLKDPTSSPRMAG